SQNLSFEITPQSPQVFSESRCNTGRRAASSEWRRNPLVTHDRDRVRQAELEFRPWGGKRRGAGRKRTRARACVSHRTRDALSPHHPVHVTVRLHDGLPNLRRDAVRAVIERSFRAVRERGEFRLAQYSLQSNHVHLIAEADDERALSRG